jgi:MFS family permease
METQSYRNIFTRDFVLAFFAQLAFTSVFHILIPTFPIYLSRWGANEIEIGVLVGTLGFTSVVLRPFVGRALIRGREKLLMIAGALLSVITSIAYLVFPPFWPLLVVRGFQGIGFACFHTAAITLIANISSGGPRGQTLSYFALAMNMSAALAPPLGMFLINRFDFTHLFLVCTALSFCSVLLAQTLRGREGASSPEPSTDDGFFLSRKALPPSIISFMSLFVWGSLTAFFPLYAVQNGVANPGLFFTALAIMLIVGRALGGRTLEVYSKDSIILPSLALCATAMVILAFSKTLLMFIVVAVIWGSGQALLMPALMVHALDRAGSSSGLAMGTFTAVSDLGIFLGPVAMGIIVHLAGYPIMFLCLALVGFVNLCCFLLFVRTRGGPPTAQAAGKFLLTGK